jgi:hypothetical protein
VKARTRRQAKQNACHTRQGISGKAHTHNAMQQAKHPPTKVGGWWLCTDGQHRGHEAKITAMHTERKKEGQKAKKLTQGNKQTNKQNRR